MNSANTASSPSNFSPSKITTLSLPIAPSYVPDWGVWQVVREFVQNAKDGAVDGFPYSVSRTSEGTVVIRNEGAVLHRNSLLLGQTSKRASGGTERDQKYLGYIGEGYKLALLAATRMGLPVSIRTGSEFWRAHFGHDSAFDGMLLKVEIQENLPAVDSIEVKIDGISDADWATCVSNMLNVEGLPATFLTASDQIVAPAFAHEGRLLLKEEHRGKLFSHGMFVANMPIQIGRRSMTSMITAAQGDELPYQYGYDLSTVQLDRDRKMAAGFDLVTCVVRLLNSAVGANVLTDDALFDLCVATEKAELQFIGGLGAYTMSWDACTRLARIFDQRYGVDVHPAGDDDQAKELDSLGIQSVQVPEIFVTMYERVRGNYRARLEKLGTRILEVYPESSLLPEERDMWDTCRLLLAEVSDFPDNVLNASVVRYAQSDVRGTCQQATGQISVARRCLASYSSTLHVLAHELAHLRFSWHDKEHGAEQARILSAALERSIILK